NSIDTRALLEQARGDKHVLREVIRTAEALLPRVRAETEDPILVSGILRDKTLDWYRRSPTDRTWTDTVPLRWGGMFHESRVPGGRLSRKLSVRLIGLINQAVEASGAVAFLRAGFSGIFRGSAMNQEEGATYDLVQGGAHASGSSAAGEGAAMDAGSSFPWEREGMTSKDWVVLLRNLGKRKTKLDPPPRDNPRGRESYLVLR